MTMKPTFLIRLLTLALTFTALTACDDAPVVPNGQTAANVQASSSQVDADGDGWADNSWDDAASGTASADQGVTASTGWADGGQVPSITPGTGWDDGGSTPSQSTGSTTAPSDSSSGDAFFSDSGGNSSSSSSNWE